MFTRPVRTTLATCVRLRYYRQDLSLHVPFRVPAAQSQRRCFATPPPQVNRCDLAVERYHALSDATMDTLWDSLEEILDVEGNPNYEVEYSSGVLTLKLGEHGTYVINKQPPNKQIWLSSPISGPKRYDYSDERDDWLYSRDGVVLSDLLNREISQIVGRRVDLRIESISTHVE